MSLHTWLYKGGRPNRLTQLINAAWAQFSALGFFRDYMVTLELKGRRSGKVVRFPLVMLALHGERYLVSMLGRDANWVRNLRAADGHAVLKHGITERIVLREVNPEERARLIKAYLKIAPGARPHIPVDKDAPLSAFEAVADRYPVFVVTDQTR